MGWMKRGLAAGAAATALMVAGCDNGAQQARNSSASGSLALSTDDSLLYAADTDNGVVSVIDTKTDSKLYDVKVGTRPYRVVVGADDTVFVANRGSRSVSVIRKGERQPSQELATGVDPTGMAVSFDGKTLYVVSATSLDNTDVGSLQAFEVATLNEKYNKTIVSEPRSIALISDGKALVTQYKGDEKGAEVAEVDLKTGEVTNAGLGIYDSLNVSKGNGSASFKTRGSADVVVTPDGKRAFVPTVLAREDAIGRKPNSSGGYYSSGGPCNLGSVATEGIVTIDTSANSQSQPKVDDLPDCASRGTTNTEADYPPTAAGTGNISGVNPSGANVEAVQGPSAAAVDPTGEWLFVVNKETSNVAIMPTSRRQGRDGENINFGMTGSSFRAVVGIAGGRGANDDVALNTGSDGIALTKDGRRAYVYSQFNHTVTRMGNAQGGPTSDVTNVATIQLGLTDTLTVDEAAGRRMFHDAQSTAISSELTHVSCATCHLEGRDDGHVWSFPDGLRQTPTLVGRGLRQTAPFHWTAEFATFDAFMQHTVTQRMGGHGLNPDLDEKILKFLDSQPAPENANIKAAGLTEAQARGQAAFVKANCNSCHAGTNLTDGTLHDVSTGDNTFVRQFDTPSLRGLARSAPYLHNGTAQSLRERLAGGGSQHGELGNLSESEKDDLVQYLKTL